MPAAPHSLPEPVTMLVTRRIAPQRYADFLDWIHEGERMAATFEGHLGSGVLAPPPGGADYQILFRFADEATLERWAGSPQRQAWLQQGADLVHASREHRVSGLEGWFGSGPTAPPRWKQAITIWLGFFPVSLGFTLLTSDWLGALPVFWRVLISTLMLTPVMVFVFIPLISRMLRPWLQPGSARATRRRLVAE